MQIFKEELFEEAAKTGFRPEILEKVWQLINVLNEINRHPFLKEHLVLKGGTALNLFVYDLPRLSVDIDLNYVGEVDKVKLKMERPKIEAGLESVFRHLDLTVRKMPGRHAGGKWQLRYKSVLSGNGNLEIDLNYMFRIPLGEIVHKFSQIVGGRQTNSVAILDIYELGAGKLTALLARQASRDLFDAHELLTKQELNKERLRLFCIIYCAGFIDLRNISPLQIDFDAKELKQQLVPVLRKNVADNWNNWANNMLEECRSALSFLFPLKEEEKDFFKILFNYGEVNGSLLLHDSSMAKKIDELPFLKWRALQAKKYGIR